MARTAGVTFAQDVHSSRRPRDDELSVMRAFARHASHCHRCSDPYQVWKRDGELCDRGHSYARDVAKYIYAKGGRPHSVIDKECFGTRTEVEIPVEYEVVRNLVKAFDKGLSLRHKSTPKISYDKHYSVEPRREQTPRYYDDVVATEIAKSSRRERDRGYHTSSGGSSDRRRTIHLADSIPSRGSLYYLDEQAKRDRRRYENEPVIILAEPRRTSKYYR